MKSRENPTGAFQENVRMRLHLLLCQMLTVLFLFKQVLDLLNPGTKRSNLRVRWDKRSRAFVVDNLFSIDCEELDDLVAVLEEGGCNEHFLSLSLLPLSLSHSLCLSSF